MPWSRLRVFSVVSFLLLVCAWARPAAAAPLPPEQRLCDPAYEDCRADILAYINQETVEIDMGFWMMTDARYASALVNAWNRGVKIRLLMDPRCVEQHPTCVTQNDQLAAAGIPMRNRVTSGILHWKTAIFVGQGQLEFAGANYAPFEMTPDQPFINYTDEVVAFTNDPALVQSFMTKFDDLWTSTTEFVNYANISGPLTRSFPVYPIDPELNFPPDESYRDRAVAAYNAENQAIDVQMFRITDAAHPAAMLAAVQRGIPVRLITDETEYRNPLRLWDAYYVDQMYANGVSVRFDGHQGIDHEKAIVLYGSHLAIFGSSNWTEPSSDTQREHNYFTGKPWVFDWLAAQFDRKWNNESGYIETKPFVPLPPDTPSYRGPAGGATGVPATGTSLQWNGGLWAHVYDVYFGTTPNPPLLQANLSLGPSQSTTDDKTYALPALQPGTTYYWKIVSKTAAGVTATGSVVSFTTAGTAGTSNKAPSVALTSPASGATFTAPATVSLSANASDRDGTVARVDFYNGSALIGTASSSPYTVTWKNVPAGTYSVTAVATDNLFASTTSPAVSVTVGGGSAPTFSVVRGPYLQQPTNHSMVVVWATKESGAGEVRYNAAGAVTTTAAAVSHLVSATQSGLAFDYYQYEATLPGLAASTSYTYQTFNSGAATSPQASFRTGPATGSGSVTFVAFADSGTGSVEQQQLADLIGRDSFDIALHAGDIAYGTPDGQGDASYTTYQSYFFDIYKWLGARALSPIEGNHDSRATNNNGQAYLDLFSLPRNGASAAFPDHAERYYSFDYGPVHVIGLDTEYTFLDPTRQAEQLRWLEADLAATTQPWKVAVLHRAPYSSGGEHGSSLDVRVAFGPLFERYGVELVLSGHEHDYERTVPIRESTVPTDHAVTYVVTGGGGAPLYPAGTSTWTAFSASRNEYVKLTADACNLTLSAIGIDGASFDGTTLTHCNTASAPPTVSLTSPVNGATTTAPGTFGLTANASDSDGTVSRVDFFAGTTLVGNAFAAPFSATWTNVLPGTYVLTAVATDNSGTTATSSPVTVTVTAAPLPNGWLNTDVGSTGAVGNTTATANGLSVTGAGADVWNTADALQYAYQTLTGDGSIVARVASVQNVATWTKAGVMFRNSLSPSAAQAFMLVSPGKGLAFQRRLSDGAGSVSTPGSFSTAPRWVKLTRAGNTITAFESVDGVAWSRVAADTFAMGTTIDVGLAVSSHVNGVLATAGFDNISITAAVPNTPPAVTLTSPAQGTTVQAPASISLAATASDSDGIARVDFYAGTTLVGSDSTSPYGVSWTGASAGTYSLTAVAIDALGATTTSAPVTVTITAAQPPPSTLPNGWTHGDIGSTGAAGSAVASNGVFTITGAGADVWGTSDALQYAYTTLAGDGSIVARVASVQNVASWTKAGVMIRNSTSPSAAQAFMLVSPGKGVAFQRRLSAGAGSVSTSGSFTTAPRWVKLTRTGNTISAFESVDGVSWSAVASDTFQMGATVDIGLGVSSHINGVLATATFDSVAVTAGASGPPGNTAPTATLTSPASGASFTAPATIALVASAADTDGSVARVDFYSGQNLLGSSTSSPYTSTWTGVSAGTYTVTAVATDNLGATGTSSPVTVTVTAPPPPSTLPAGWAHSDIGSVPLPGAASFANGTFTVKGSGVDIWGTSDQFHYAYEPLTGDRTVVVRVASVQNVSTWVKAGIMIRETLAANSAHASLFVSSAKGVAFQRRDATGIDSVHTSGTLSQAPRWIKLSRAGNLFSAYESADGVTWTLVGTDTIPMATTVYVGLAVTSHTTSASATCTFDGLNIQ
ncbi:MAG TPA: Ig-like domain-containing protein [Vicinamibacterales bacterium]|nr:Ig-like domain-containing protein [Vicinamibacterales bacterium]